MNRIHSKVKISSIQDQSISRSRQKSELAANIKKKNKLRKRLSVATIVAGGLIATGILTAVLNPTSQIAVADIGNSKLIGEGKVLYQNNCMSCHGANLEGISDRGPNLLGVGEASVYFQVSTGRMPAARVEAQPVRKPPKFDEHQTEAVAAYVQALGGGPTVYRTPDGRIATDADLTNGNAARGSELYRLNCSSCHNFTGQGGALSGGKFAPPLNDATAQQIYDAMQSGPQSMPVFSDRQLSPENKKDIITFIKLATKTAPSGGYDLGGFGPVSEGIVMWVVGIGAIVALAMWIGARD